MKFCLIHNTWEQNARRGAEQLLVTISNELRRRGDEVIIIASRPWGARLAGESGVYLLGSGYASLERWPKWVRLAWHLFNTLNPIKYFQVKRILEREKPDLVWTHNLVGLGFLIFFLCRNRRHIHTIHDIQLLHPSGLLMYGEEGIITSLPARMYQFLLRSLIPRASLIISPSTWLLDLHVRRGFFKYNQKAVIPNPTAFEKKQRPEKTDRQTFNFLYVGQIEPHKGVDILIEAFKSLESQLARLRLIGDGSLLSGLRESGDSRIEFLGRRTSAEVKEVMLDSDCLVVPSICYENQPTVILEAFASGIPVIGSCFGGVKELLDNEKVLFEPNVNHLRDKLREVMQPSWIWPSVASTTPFTPAKYLEKVLALIS